MEKKKNNDIRLLGLILTKKSAYYLSFLSLISFALSFLLMFNALEVLLDARTIYQYDPSLYFPIILLGFSNLMFSSILMGISGYTSKRIRTFRKSLKNQ
ncbi:MAG: hypothetical protein V3V33_06875 [Candidatus Lokiarchaeia archaeon]